MANKNEDDFKTSVAPKNMSHNEFKKKLIENNINLVHSLAQRFKNRGTEYDDIVQSGCIGLVKAANSFDESKGIKFSTYAFHVIFGEIKQSFRNNNSFKVGRKLKEFSIKIKKETENYFAIYGMNPTISELAKCFGVSSEQIVEALESTKIPLSLNKFTEDDENESIDVPVDFDEEGISNRIALIEALKGFDKENQKIIDLRFFRGLTQAQTAKILNMTQVKVSRTEKVLLQKLKRKLT